MIEKLIENCRALGINEERFIEDTYYEIVFYTREMSEWTELFTNFLDSAVKLPGTPPTKEQKELTRPYGGIMKDQTLFRKEFKHGAIIAMFWPWKDSVHSTLKLIVV